MTPRPKRTRPGIWTDDPYRAHALREYGVTVVTQGARHWYPLRAGLFLGLIFGRGSRRGAFFLQPPAARGLRRVLRDRAFWEALQAAKTLGGEAAVTALLEALPPDARG